MIVYEIIGRVYTTPDGCELEQLTALDYISNNFYSVSDKPYNVFDTIPRCLYHELVKKADYSVAVDASNTVKGYAIIPKNDKTDEYFNLVTRNIRDCIVLKYPDARLFYKIISNNENELKINVIGDVESIDLCEA